MGRFKPKTVEPYKLEGITLTQTESVFHQARVDPPQLPPNYPPPTRPSDPPHGAPPTELPL